MVWQRIHIGRPGQQGPRLYLSIGPLKNIQQFRVLFQTPLGRRGTGSRLITRAGWLLMGRGWGKRQPRQMHMGFHLLPGY